MITIYRKGLTRLVEVLSGLKNIALSEQWVPCFCGELPSRDNVPFFGVLDNAIYVFFMPAVKSEADYETMRAVFVQSRIREKYGIDLEMKLVNEAVLSVLSGNLPSSAYMAYRDAVDVIKTESVTYKHQMIINDQQAISAWNASHSDVDFSDVAIQAALAALPAEPEIPEETIPVELSTIAPPPLFLPEIPANHI